LKSTETFRRPNPEETTARFQQFRLVEEH